MSGHYRTKGYGAPIALAIAAAVFVACATGTTACASKDCTFEGSFHSNGASWKCDCNICGCDNGTVLSTGAVCTGNPPGNLEDGSSDGSEPGEGSLGDAGLDALGDAGLDSVVVEAALDATERD